MPRLTLIAYYWPPAAGGGVLRWLSYTRELSRLGWDVTVVVPDKADAPLEDPSLERKVDPTVRVLRRPIWEPYRLYRRLVGRRADEKLRPDHVQAERRGPREELATWLRGNLFIPDARAPWLATLTPWLIRTLRRERPDVLVTTGPPHSLHLAGLLAQRATGVRWVADFRDPWTGIEYHQDLKLTPTAARLHTRLEREVLARADEVVTVSPSWARELGLLGGRAVHVVPNGFDEDLSGPAPAAGQGNFVVTHVGLFGKERNPPGLWPALARLRDQGVPLAVELIGVVDDHVLAAATAAGLADVLRTPGPVSHAEALAAIQRASVLLLPLASGEHARGRIPGKLFEYLAARRFVLALARGPSDAAEILEETRAGSRAAPDDVERIHSCLQAAHAAWKRGHRPPGQNVERYARAHLAVRYDQLLRAGSR